MTTTRKIGRLGPCRAAMLLLASISVPSLGHAASPEPSVGSVPAETRAVAIDDSELPIFTPEDLDEIARGAESELGKRDLDPSSMRISLVVIDPVKLVRGVRITIETPEVRLDGDGDPRGPIVGQCSQCSTDMLKTVAVEGVIEALRRYDGMVEAAEAEAEEAPEPTASSPESLGGHSEGGSGERAPRRPLRPLGWAGIGLLSAGVATAATGGVFVGVGTRPMPARFTTLQDHERDFAPPGYSMLAVGGALAVAGAIMLVVERRRSRGTEVGASARITPSSAGIVLRGRF